MRLPFLLVTITIINHGFALCSPLGRLAVQELSEKFLLEKLPVTPCRLVPFLRAKPGHTHPWLQHLAYINAIVQTRGPRSALRNSAAPVPVNDVLGPRLLYRDFTDCAQHVKSHPGPVRLNYLRLAVRGPLRVNAPHHIGFKHFLNSAPSLWRGIGRNNVRGRRLRPRWPFPAIRGRTPSPAFIHLATVQAENKTTRLTTTLGQHVTHSLILTPSHLYNQSNRIKHVTCTSTATGLPASKVWLHHAASRADRKARLKVNGNAADAFASYTWQKKINIEGRGLERTCPTCQTPRVT